MTVYVLKIHSKNGSYDDEYAAFATREGAVQAAVDDYADCYAALVDEELEVADILNGGSDEADMDDVCYTIIQMAVNK